MREDDCTSCLEQMPKKCWCEEEFGEVEENEP